ncbi:MAG: RNA methyltransferase [Gemmatimonadaceae bacterium]
MRSLTAARDLQRRRARERTGQFLAEGVRCVEELMASPLRLRSVLVSPGINETQRGARLLDLIRNASAERHLQIDEVTDSELASVSDTETPQGILAIADQPERSFGNIDTNIDTRGLVLLLDGVQDPGNVGTILRTAQAFGVSATVALTGTADLWNPKVVRSAMGALFNHNAFHASTEDALKFLNGIGMPIWATSATGGRVAKRSGDSGLAIVVGNEAAGVSPELVAAAARTVAIPIVGVESLNVAVATGILLYAVTAA